MQKQKNMLQTIIVALVALAGLAASVFCLVWRLQNAIPAFSYVLIGTYYLCILYYGIAGYKTPHGNTIRYLLLILAFYIAASIIVMIERWEISWIIVAASSFAAVSIGYMAGRLQKVKKNIIVVVLATALLAVKSFWPVAEQNNNFVFVLDRTLPLLMWATVVLIYFFRFSAHKEAGLQADAEED
ncbi:MAG: hypothetical protein II621_07925 [Clostridia bacterium]|nr:hypothetical protein [Clostridia bacterium]